MALRQGTPPPVHRQGFWRRDSAENTFLRSKTASSEAMETAFWRATKWWISRCVLIDGSYHDVDSSEMAFKIAGSMAFKEACRKASPKLLEPIMKVEVVVPEDYMGPVIARPELAARPDAGRANRAAAPRSSTCWCRCRKCSVMPPTFAARRRGAAALPCTSRITSRRPTTSRKKSSAERTAAQGKEVAGSNLLN